MKISTKGRYALRVMIDLAEHDNGEYITPIFYTELQDSNGKTVLKPTQEKRRVLSVENAYITCAGPLVKA